METELLIASSTAGVCEGFGTMGVPCVGGNHGGALALLLREYKVQSLRLKAPIHLGQSEVDAV